MNRHEILKNSIDSDERFALAKLLDNLENCVKYHERGFTDFLDPYKAEKFTSVIRRHAGTSSVNVAAYGGYESAERQIIGLSPDYMSLEAEDFPIGAVKIENPAKLGKELTHRDYLGSVLGLGLDRGKVGDVLLTGSGAFVLLETGVMDYVCANLTQVARTGVETFPVAADELYALVDSVPTRRITVQSMRLDAVISAACNLSRSKSSQIISSGKVFVNWLEADNAAAQVKKGDTITLRGTGRVKILDVLGNTKKGGIALEVLKNG